MHLLWTDWRQRSCIILRDCPRKRCCSTKTMHRSIQAVLPWKNVLNYNLNCFRNQPTHKLASSDSHLSGKLKNFLVGDKFVGIIQAVNKYLEGLEEIHFREGIGNLKKRLVKNFKDIMLEKRYDTEHRLLLFILNQVIYLFKSRKMTNLGQSDVKNSLMTFRWTICHPLQIYRIISLLVKFYNI